MEMYILYGQHSKQQAQDLASRSGGRTFSGLPIRRLTDATSSNQYNQPPKSMKAVPIADS